MNSVSSSRPLDGKVALITGASSGIGEATAIALAIAGAKVAIAARRAERLSALAKAIGDAGGQALEIVADVTKPSDIARMIDTVVEEFDRLDILVNNAGVMLLSPLAEARGDDLQADGGDQSHRAYGTYPLGAAASEGEQRPYRQHLFRRWPRRQSRRIGLRGNQIRRGRLSEAVRREVYADKVRVTVIEPGLVLTELGDHITNPGMKAGLEQRKAAMEGLEAEDIAAAVLYAVTQPARVNVNEILLRPTDQER